MADKQRIEADLHAALMGQKSLSAALYADVLANFEATLQVSLHEDADDALLCMLVDEGEVAMMLIDWNGAIHRNDAALQKLQHMWQHSFEADVQQLLPIFSAHICQDQLGVAGIKWEPVPKS